MPTRTIIITGVAGFIGSHLAAALMARGDRVVGLDNFDPFYDRRIKEENLASIDGPTLEFHETDILDTASVTTVLREAEADLVINIAALAGVRPSLKAPGRYTRVNILGLVSMLEAMRATGLARLVHASSSSVYGNNARVPFAESDPVARPISPYAASKRAAELVAQCYTSTYGFSVAALRFFTVFGPGQRPDLAIGAFMRRIAKGEALPMFGDGSTSRDYTYIDDIVFGVVAAVDRVAGDEPGAFHTWNLGRSDPVGLRDMIDAIGRVVGREPVIQQMPLQTGDVERTYADVSSARKELDYRPSVSFEEGLKRQWEWLEPRLESLP